MKLFSKLRGYSALTIPLPIQTLSAKLWSDEKHVEESRKNYNIKFNYADKVLVLLIVIKDQKQIHLWMNVGNGERFKKNYIKT